MVESLIFDRRADLPNGRGLHAILIGISDYPGLPSNDEPLGDALRSLPKLNECATTIWAVADKLVDLDAEQRLVQPLVTVRVVQSPGWEEKAENAELSSRGAPAITDEILQALHFWREDVGRSVLNQALFYFCGHSIRTSRDEAVLLPSDFATDGMRASSGLSLSNIRAGMAPSSRWREIGRQQFYFVESFARDDTRLDANANNARHVFDVDLSAKDDRSAVTVFATQPYRRWVPRLPSAFGAALISGFDVATTGASFERNEQTLWQVTVPSLFEALQTRRDEGIDVELAGWIGGELTIALSPMKPRRLAELEAEIAARSSAAAAEPVPPAPVPPREREEANTEFVPDDAEVERDELGRSVLAIGLARRLHRIWRKTNLGGAPTSAGSDDRGAFVVHIDAPWGGGKTTFANYLAQTLNPQPSAKRPPALFLRTRFPGRDVRGIFLADPFNREQMDRAARYPDDARRPWIIVPFNAWRAEDCTPPWWIFYQTIRKHCFEAIRTEGNRPWHPADSMPAPPPIKRTETWLDAQMGRAFGWLVTRAPQAGNWLAQQARWLALWGEEYLWRLSNPKVRSLLLTAIAGVGLLTLLYVVGAWGTTVEKSKVSAGFVLTNGIGLLLAGLTGVSALWGVAALFTESIIPGTDTLAERLSLGSGDPFERFRRHFYGMVARVKRPVMVVVDDLDRCGPQFVVDLVRGMQTLLRSPRLVFVVLGDRDWIERSFENHHEKMSKVDIGPDQSLGARFVEKAIQMSFILPAIGRDSQSQYLRATLLGTSAEGPNTGLSREVEAQVQEVANQAAAATSSAPLDTSLAVQATIAHLETTTPDAVDSDALRRRVEQAVSDAKAINAAADETVEAEVGHQLQALAGFFPQNPRQIKRIVNAITIYYAAALQRPGVDLNDAFRVQLAIWIILMTEWPRTWRLLAACPELADVLASPDPVAALATVAPQLLPGSVAATRIEIGRVIADPTLIALISADREADKPALQSSYTRLLAELTPLHRRQSRLPEPPAGTEHPVRPGGFQARLAARRSGLRADP